MHSTHCRVQTLLARCVALKGLKAALTLPPRSPICPYGLHDDVSCVVSHLFTGAAPGIPGFIQTGPGLATSLPAIPPLSMYHPPAAEREQGGQDESRGGLGSVDRLGADARDSGRVLGGEALKGKELQDILDILRDSHRLQYDLAAARRQDAPREPRQALGATISPSLRPACGVPASAETHTRACELLLAGGPVCDDDGCLGWFADIKLRVLLYV